MVVTVGEVEGEMSVLCGAAVGASVDIIASAAAAAAACRPGIAMGVPLPVADDDGASVARDVVSVSSCHAYISSQ